MDGDLQNDPEDIPRLFIIFRRKSRRGFWLACSSKRSLFEAIFSLRSHFLRRLLLRDGIHDSGCSLKIYKRECFEGLRLYGEMHRFIPALLQNAWISCWRAACCALSAETWKTKYNWNEHWKGFSIWLPFGFGKNIFSDRFIFGRNRTLLWFLVSLSAFYSLFKFSQGIDLSDNALTSLALFCFFFEFNSSFWEFFSILSSKFIIPVQKKRRILLRETLENQNEKKRRESPVTPCSPGNGKFFFCVCF